MRIGEGAVTEKLVEDGVFEFVYMCWPRYAMGSTAGNSPPVALSQRAQERGRPTSSYSAITRQRTLSGSCRCSIETMTVPNTALQPPATASSSASP